jgi:hypothetical protein
MSETFRVLFQNKCEKLVYLVGFIVRKSVTMRGHMNVKLETCIGNSYVKELSLVLVTVLVRMIFFSVAYLFPDLSVCIYLAYNILIFLRDNRVFCKEHPVVFLNYKKTK